MGYEVHITRKTHWFDNDGPAISLPEWLAYVSVDPEMRLDGYAEAQTPDDLLRVDDDGIAVWTAYGGHGVDGNMAWFCHFGDRITVKNPDELILAKMQRIAIRLGAKVQGDEGEAYGCDGRPTNNDDSRIEIRPISAAAAAQVSAYRYPPPYDVYNVAPENVAENARYMLATENQVFAVFRAEVLIGFCSFGDDARVPGGEYSGAALDLGIGLDPALTGQGLGRVVTEAMIAVALAQFDPPALRTTVAAFNERSLRLCWRLGFREASRFLREGDGAEFVIMTRPAAGRQGSEAKRG